MRRLLANLLDNAKQHTPQGTIIIRATADDEFVAIEVRDTGEGVDSVLAGRIGEPFALNEGIVGNRHVHGSGMGMAICRGIAAAHGGSISLKSKVAFGTAVFVRLKRNLAGPVTTENAAAIICQIEGTTR